MEMPINTNKQPSPKYISALSSNIVRGLGRGEPTQLLERKMPDLWNAVVKRLLVRPAMSPTLRAELGYGSETR